MKTLKFSIWAKDFGIKNLATACDVTAHQVRNWMNGKASPRSERLVKIISLSKNKFTLNELIQETTRTK